MKDFSRERKGRVKFSTRKQGIELLNQKTGSVSHAFSYICSLTFAISFCFLLLVKIDPDEDKVIFS
jgi:hypothetical protein